MAGLCLILCVVSGIRATLDPTKQSVYPDYEKAGQAWLHGEDAYQIERDADGVYIPRMSGYRYSPLVAVLLVPFGLLPSALGGVAWRLFSMAFFLWAFAWFVRAVLPVVKPLGEKSQAAMWLLIIPLSVGSMNNGQANVLLIGLLLAAGSAVVEQRWNLATVFLGGAVFLKIYPLAIVLLLLTVYPRQLGWRFGLAVIVGLALPFCFQQPAYVWGQYHNWFDLVFTDNRRDFPMSQGYRDFYLLTRFVGTPLKPSAYLTLQLGAAALVAGICLLGRLQKWPRSHLIQTLLGLGCCWMIVFGPSVESCTFILIAPALAWSIVDAFQAGRQAWVCAVPLLILGMFSLTFMAAWFPGGRDWFYVLQPLSAALLFIERLARCRPQAQPAVVLQAKLPQAA